MRKIHWIILLSTLGFLILIGSLYLYNLYNVPVLSKEDIQKLSEEAKEQRENITKQTVFEPFEFKKPNKNKNKHHKRKKRTTLRIPTWSPTVVLTEPEHA